MEIPSSPAVGKGREEERFTVPGQPGGENSVQASPSCRGSVWALIAKADCWHVRSQGTHKRCQFGVELWQPEQHPARRLGYSVCVAHPSVGFSSRPRVRLRGVRLSKIQDGNSAKPPSCKIRGSWWSQGCTVLMLQEASCRPRPVDC